MRILFFAILVTVLPLQAQQRRATAEDSVSSFLSSILSSTSIGGYGNAFYQRNLDNETATVNLERVVLFVGHRFSPSIAFFSELEVEDAKVSGGEDGGEVAFEQAYIRFDLNSNNYITAGLFIPRIGILNESHLPNEFNGNERTLVETYIIPSTWRELGVGFYGSASDFQYTVALVNGLNAAGFEHGSGIRGGRYEGRTADAGALAVTGSLRYTQSGLTAQVSGYYGGSVSQSAANDLLFLDGGTFGTPVALGEADFRYESDGFTAKALGTIVEISDAKNINWFYDSNTPTRMFGGYGEIGYNLFQHAPFAGGKALVAFFRYERLDLNAALPPNGVDDPSLRQDHFIMGVSYFPDPNVVVKADFRISEHDNPASSGSVSRSFLNIGIGFSF